jgi:hypothetical protein
MARIRSVHPGLASDEAYMTMSMAAKAAWPMLWTECDDHGLFEWKPIVLKARIFPADAVDFAAILAEYVELGCIMRVEIDGKPFGLVKNFGNFQRPKNPSYRYPWREEFGKFAGFNEGQSGSPTPALPQQGVSPTEKLSQMKEEGGRKKEDISVPSEPRPKQVRTGYADDFEKFWNSCAQWRGNSGKREAFDVWRKLSSEDKTAAAAGVPGYSAALRVPNAPSPLHVCRFLKYRRFEVYANNVLPFAAGSDPPRPTYTAEEKRRIAEDFDRRYRAGEFG